MIVQMHIVGDVFWEGLDPGSLLGCSSRGGISPIKHFVEFAGWQIGVGTPADLPLCHLTVEVERGHLTLAKQHSLVHVPKEVWLVLECLIGLLLVVH